MEYPNRKVLFRGLIAVAGLIFLSLVTTARLGSQQVAGVSSPKDAVVLLRLLNTSESKHRSASGVYADWNQLSGSRIPQTLMDEMKQNSRNMTPPPEPPAFDLDSAQPLHGYTLAVYTSSDRVHYVAVVRPNPNSDPCLESFYTGDDGLIQSAKTIGCK
jgi:hypothetical protein